MNLIFFYTCGEEMEKKGARMRGTSITLLSLDRVAHTSGFNDKHRMGKMPMPRGTGVPPVRIGFTT